MKKPDNSFSFEDFFESDWNVKLLVRDSDEIRILFKEAESFSKNWISNMDADHYASLMYYQMNRGADGIYFGCSLLDNGKYSIGYCFYREECDYVIEFQDLIHAECENRVIVTDAEVYNVLEGNV